MKKRVFTTFRAILVVGAVVCLSACSSMSVASRKPNIIVISTDQLGYMDIPEYAHRLTGETKRKMYYETPNLDRLVSEGLCFGEAYACPDRSSASPAALVDSATPTHFGKNGGLKRTQRGLSMDKVLPGYDSAYIGKWGAVDTPEAAGFAQMGVSDARSASAADDFTAQALRYLGGRSWMRGKPFFLYYNHSTADNATAAKEKGVKHFSNKRTRGWNGQSDPHYALKVKELDDAVGQILHKLWRTGLDESAVVIFMPASGHVSATSMRKGSVSLAGADRRVPLIVRWDKFVKPGSWSNVPVDSADILPTVMQCAGYFPESLSEEAGMIGCSLSGLFWDTQNKSASYERNIKNGHYPCISGGPATTLFDCQQRN